MTIPDLRLIFKETVYIGGGRGWTGGFSHNLFSFFDTFIQQIVELVPCYMQVPMNFLILFAFFIMTFSLLLSLMIGLDWETFFLIISCLIFLKLSEQVPYHLWTYTMIIKVTTSSKSPVRNSEHPPRPPSGKRYLIIDILLIMLGGLNLALEFTCLWYHTKILGIVVMFFCQIYNHAIRLNISIQTDNKISR